MKILKGMEPARNTPVYVPTTLPFPTQSQTPRPTNETDRRHWKNAANSKKQDRNEAKTEKALEKTEKPATFEKKKASSRHNSLTSAARFLAPRSTARQLSFTVARVHRKMLRAVSAPR